MKNLITTFILIMCILTPSHALASSDSEYIEEFYTFTMEEVDLFTRVLYSECRGESYEGRLMVAQCIVDRLYDGTWGETLHEVIYSKDQFAKPATKIEEPEAFNELYELALSVLMHGEKFDSNLEILYFQKSDKQNWHAPWLGKIGCHSYYGYIITYNHMEYISTEYTGTIYIGPDGIPIIMP